MPAPLSPCVNVPRNRESARTPLDDLGRGFVRPGVNPAPKLTVVSPDPHGAPGRAQCVHSGFLQDMVFPGRNSWEVPNFSACPTLGRTLVPA
jgi:hypothetical protein